MSNNNNPNGSGLPFGFNGFGNNASSSTISTRSTISHASNQSNGTNNTNHNPNLMSALGLGGNPSSSLGANGVVPGVTANGVNGVTAGSAGLGMPQQQQQQQGQGQAGSVGIAGQQGTSNGVNNNNNMNNMNNNNNNGNNGVGGGNGSLASNMSQLLGGVGANGLNSSLLSSMMAQATQHQQQQQQQQNGHNNNNNNNNNHGNGNNGNPLNNLANLNGLTSNNNGNSNNNGVNGGNNGNNGANGLLPGGAGGFGGLGGMFSGAAAAGASQLAGIPAIGDIQMGNAGNVTGTASEIQKFAEQSRNHGKMIEFFIENHLPPLMKTDKLIKELGKMDFDTFQQNYQSNQNLLSNNYGFEFDHLRPSAVDGPNNNNNNSLPSLEKDTNAQTENYKREINELRTQLANSQKNMQELKNQYFKVNNESQRLQQENQQLRGTVERLQSQLMSVGGSSPRYELVKFTENEQINGLLFAKSTQTIAEFKAEIVRRKGINAENWNIEADKEFNDYLDGVLVYLNHNEDGSNGIGVCNGGGSSNEDAVNDYTPQNEMIEVFKISNHPRIALLNGSNGLRAKRTIEAKTVIGQYFGTEYMMDEFERVFGNTKEFPLKQVYAYKLDVTMPKSKENMIGNNNSGENSNNNSSKWIDNHNYSVIIDAFLDHKTCHLLTNINDCRKTISSGEMSNEDKMYENIKFVKVYVDGWPMVFAVACKRIEQGTELMAYYGKDFCLSIQNANKRSNNNSSNMNNNNDNNASNGNNNNSTNNHSGSNNNNTNEDLDLTTGN